MADNFSKINNRYQTTDSRISKNTKQNKYSKKKKNLLPGITYSKYRKSKTEKKRRNLERSQRTNIFSLQKPKY